MAKTDETDRRPKCARLGAKLEIPLGAEALVAALAHPTGGSLINVSKGDHVCSFGRSRLLIDRLDFTAFDEHVIDCSSLWSHHDRAGY